MIEKQKIDELIATLYSEIVSYNKEVERCSYDEQDRRANREELRVLDAKIEARRSIIKRLEALGEEAG